MALTAEMFQREGGCDSGDDGSSSHGSRGCGGAAGHGDGHGDGRGSGGTAHVDHHTEQVWAGRIGVPGAQLKASANAFRLRSDP